MNGQQGPFPFPPNGQVSPQAQAMLGMLIDAITGGVIHKLGSVLNPTQPVQVRFKNPDGSVGVTTTSIAQLLANIQVSMQKMQVLIDHNNTMLDDVADMLEESNRLTAEALNQAQGEKPRKRKRNRDKEQP